MNEVEEQKELSTSLEEQKPKEDSNDTDDDPFEV